VSGQYHTPANLPSRKNPSIHRVEGWVGSRAVVDVLGKRKNLLPLLGFEPKTSSLQPSHYIDYSISAATRIKIYSENKIIMDHKVHCMKHEDCKKIVSKLSAQVLGFIHNAYSLLKIFSL
jgi:hypothetical protein